MISISRASGARRVLHRDRSGQALVEFALVVPLLLILIVGVVELSRAWNAHQVITNTAREALRSAVVDNPLFTQEQMQARINEQLALASLDPSRAEVLFDGWKAGTGNPARIELRYRFDFDILGPLMEWAAGRRSVTLHTGFVMRNE
ncbi:MAG TPA: TadE/TadG family type IV pilus assembly protein [Longimicrobiales bacterium]|nr:TadE/TadG family type IV pilus assembly protein [Longimicrobiales bacterium]